MIKAHRLSGRQLAALTAMHNFYVRRPDGPTAAERFCGLAHPALFDQVLAHGHRQRGADDRGQSVCLR